MYVGFPDKFPLGAAMNKGLTFKMGQTHMQKYMRPLLEKIEKGEIDPSFVITHTLPLEDGPGGVQDLPRQAGRVHQGGAQAVMGFRRGGLPPPQPFSHGVPSHGG